MYHHFALHPPLSPHQYLNSLKYYNTNFKIIEEKKMDDLKESYLNFVK